MQEPAGGPENFASKVDEFKGYHPMTIFSGDFLNPSISMCDPIPKLGQILAAALCRLELST